jgi:peptide/nickel transport system substrate-binding protein
MASAEGGSPIRRLVAGAAIVVLVSGGIAGAAAARMGGQAAAKKVLRYGVPANIVSAGVSNPTAIPSTDGPVLSIAYAPIIHDNPDGSFSPGLAVKWRFVGGHKVFEFTLRRNARYSDGTPVTAANVVSYLNWFAKTKSIFAGLLGPKPKFRAVDKWTVRITMSVPNPSMPLLLSEENVTWGFVASPKAVANNKLFDRATYGAGPYKLDYAHTVPGDHYTFVPNPYYWDKSAIKFKQIYMKAFADASSALQAQQAGQIDVQWSTDSSTAAAAESAGLQVVSAPFAVQFFQLNAKESKPLSDARVRQAMNYAIDRKAIAKALYGKYASGSAEFTITPDADPGLQNSYAYNPTKAKSLLAAAGYSNGFSFQMDVGNSAGAKVAGLVASYLQAVGIKATVMSFPTGGAYVNAIFAFKDDSWLLAADVGVPTPIEYPSFIGSASAFGPPEPVNPEVYRLYYSGLKSSNPSKDWKKMWSIITTDAWFLPIATISDLVYVSKSVGGVKMSPANPYSYPTQWFFK